MDTLFDYAGAMQRLGNDEQLFQEMIRILREDAPRRFQELDAGWRSGDLAIVHRAAHSLKGLVSNFGAARAQAAALRLEQAAKHDDRDGIPDKIAELHSEVQSLLLNLEPMAAARSATSRVGVGG
jgi:two-component system, sensor histidine kinase and response regulator